MSERITVDLAHLSEGQSFRTTAASGLDPETFRKLDAAIRGRRRLAIHYYSASRDEEKAREVDPYHLASVDGQWYLVGHCHLRGEVRMFAPSRMRSIEATGITFESPGDFRIDAYLAQSFSVLRGGEGEIYRVRLRFSGEAVKYVRERIWHPTQSSEVTPEGDLIVDVEVSHLREVERWVLSWGSECIVVEPAELKERVSRTLAEAANRYMTTAGPTGGPSIAPSAEPDSPLR